MYLTHITQYFDFTVTTHGDRIAVQDGDVSVTFQELYEMVLCTAYQINQKLKKRKGQIIAVYLPKSLAGIVAQIGILYSGNTYMNLDIKCPEQRTKAILEQTLPSLMIVQEGENTSFAEDIAILSLTNIKGEKLAPKDREITLALREQHIDTDPMCIINTSGSTGTPKAVTLTHRGFIDYIESITLAGLIGEAEIAASLAPPVFDHYSFELCLMMSRACTLVLIPETYAVFPLRMLELMAERKVTFLFWVPTIMVTIANMDLLSQIALPELKTVWFAGEVFPTAKFNYWRKHLPWAKFVNLYGPAEITVDCVYHIIQRDLSDDEPIPIGKSLPNTDILVLDEQGRTIKEVGKEGELCVRGSSLAMGYYNNPEKTAEAFIQNPLNTKYPERIYRTGDMVSWNKYGELIFKGRKDTLIKMRGYRIELAEIEHIVINSLKLVPNCCVLYDPKPQKIVLVYEAPSPVEEAELRRKIGEVLPRYMVPTVYLHLSELPRNTSGKIDRLQLRQYLA